VVTIKRRQVPATELIGGGQLPPLINRLYAARGITCVSQIDYTLKHLSHANSMPGIDAAADLIVAALKAQKRIMVVGDFDADGATATVLMLQVLRSLGAKNLDYQVPNRFEYGYGLTAPLVEELKVAGCQLIITVDNGISSLAGVELARSYGMQVIITDHHLPPVQLPPADAIVNPSLKDSHFGSQALAGVGVAFYLLTRVLRRAKEQKNEQHLTPDAINLTHYLDLVALGTIADVVPLDYNNRILIDAGLKRLRHGLAGVGMRALFKVAGCDMQRVDAQMLAFLIAPRLNAAGRLKDMSIGIELLLTTDENRAEKLAAELDAINRERKTIQGSMQTMADSVIKQLQKDLKLTSAICIYHRQWHQGVVGLLASKVKEYTQRPVVAFADEDSDSEWVKGSARSIDGLHIRDALVQIDIEHPGLIKKFGGHAMAAGLTLKKSALSEFKKQLCRVVDQLMGDLPDRQVVVTDGPVNVDELSLFTAELLQDAGPWGAGFEPPLFDDYFIVRKKSSVAEIHTRLTLQTTDFSKQIEAIAFNFLPQQFPEAEQTVHLCYQLQVNEFRGRKRLQLLVRHIV